MKCVNCGTELVPGNNTCPSCGALNMGFNQETPATNFNDNQAAFSTTAIPVQNVNNVTATQPVKQVSAPVVNTQATPVETAMDAINQMQMASNAPMQPSIPVQDSIPVQPVSPDNQAVAQVQETNMFDDDTEELEEEQTQVSADIAPPTLDVEKENLTAGVTDLSAANATATTYETEPAPEVVNNDATQEVSQADSVDISIPSVQAPVDNTNTSVDGNATDVSAQQTVGQETKQEDLEEHIEVEHKSKHLRINLQGKNSLPLPIVLIGLVLFLLMGLGLGSVLFSKNYCAVASNKTEVSTATVANGKSNVTQAGSFTYKIPESYIYDRYNQGLYIYDGDDTYRMYIKDYDGSYEDLANSKASIKSSLEEQSLTINSIQEMKISDKNYVVVEATNAMYNVLLGFTEGSNDKVFYFEIVDASNNFNYDVLEVVNDIIINAKYNTEVSNMEKINLIDVADISILTASAFKSDSSE